MSEMWQSVKKLEDGESLNADVLNKPIEQLSERTQFLYNRLLGLGENMSSVVLKDVYLSESDTPVAGNVVFLDKDKERYIKARAAMDLFDDFRAADSSFAIGIVQSPNGTTGNVVVYGKLNISSIDIGSIIETGETYRPGRYYLSEREAGKLTAYPNGPLIYVCSISGQLASDNKVSGGIAVINPQFLDIGTSHVHRAAAILARPAGTLSTAGYLPESHDDPEKAISIKFGGEWTGPSEGVAYDFSLPEGTVEWSRGVDLSWKEWLSDSEKAVDGGPVKIYADGVEVPISNGITARVIFPESTPTTAYSGKSKSEVTWPTLVFPESGRGWLDHERHAVASSADSSEPNKVDIFGTLEESPVNVNIYFPSAAAVVKFSDNLEGKTFSYGGIVFYFTLDAEGYDGGNTPVQIGATQADTMRNLSSAIRDVGLEGLSFGERLIIYDDVSVGGDGIIAASTYTRYESDIPSQSRYANLAVIYRDDFDALGDPAYLRFNTSVKISDTLSAVLHNDEGANPIVPASTTMSCRFFDDEPDALFDYNIGFDRKIADFWPPVPAAAAALIVNGVEMDNKALLPDAPTVSFGRETIHWFEDAKQRKPWPESFVERDAYIEPAYDKAMVMHWVRGFQGATGPVTSIQPKDGSPLKVYAYGTDRPGNTGDLEIDIAMDFKMDNGGLPGYIVPKDVRNGRLRCGPVVEKIVGGPGIAVVSRVGNPVGQGTVQISLDDGAFRSQFSDIALENAEQAKIGMFPYVRLKGYATSITSPSAFTAMMRVPTNLDKDTFYALVLQASVFGEIGFEAAAQKVATVKMSYNILPDYLTDDTMKYRSLKSSLLRPNNERTVNVPFGHLVDGVYVYNAFDPVIVKSRETSSEEDEDDVVSLAFGSVIPTVSDFVGQTIDGQEFIPHLRPGNLVGVRISRAVTPSGFDAYTSPLGFINLSWVLVSAPES